MKLKTYLSTVAMAVIMASCVDGQGIGIKLENMNDSVAPGTDFYQYACGGWIKNNPLKPEYSRFGSFDAVAETNREQMKELILSLANEKHEKGSVAQKIGDLYTMLMDSTRQNADGIKPIEADLNKIADVQTREEALRLIVENGLKGASELWGTGIGADMMDSKNNLVSMGQSGLSMGQKEYYLSDD